MALTHYRPAMLLGNGNIYFGGSFQLSIVTNKKISPLWNLKFNNLGISQSFKLRFLLKKKILPLSLNLNFTPNTLGCYG